MTSRMRYGQLARAVSIARHRYDGWERGVLPPLGKCLDITAESIERCPAEYGDSPRDVIVTWYHLVLQRADLQIGKVTISEK